MKAAKIIRNYKNRLDLHKSNNWRHDFSEWKVIVFWVSQITNNVLYSSDDKELFKVHFLKMYEKWI